MRRARKPKAIRNEARGTWVIFPVVNGRRTTRKLGNLNQLTQAEADERAAEMLRSIKLRAERTVPTVEFVVKQYRTEKLSKLRHSTQRAAESWLKVHILPKWGAAEITDLKPRPVELWLDSLSLAPRTRAHIRELLHRLVDFSMWAGLTPVATNPIGLVTVRGSSKRRQQPRSLRVEEFHALSAHLAEPFKTMALVQVCLGLRVSELLALKWRDVDWIGSKVNVNHGIVAQRLDSVKTEGSRKSMNLDRQVLSVLLSWRQVTEFRVDDDWMFASPHKLGRLPYSYTGYHRVIEGAAKTVGLGHLGTHSFRHTYRSWLDAVGTAITVQQKLMRHADIQTTLNIYGDVVTDEMRQAGAKIAELALRSDSTLIPTLAND